MPWIYYSLRWATLGRDHTLKIISVYSRGGKEHRVNSQRFAIGDPLSAILLFGFVSHPHSPISVHFVNRMEVNLVESLVGIGYRCHDCLFVNSNLELGKVRNLDSVL